MTGATEEKKTGRKCGAGPVDAESPRSVIREGLPKKVAWHPLL